MTEKVKRLFICECVCNTAGIMTSSKDIYVVAENPKQAEELAMQWMRGNKWKYDDYVRTVTCLASTDKCAGDVPLIA